MTRNMHRIRKLLNGKIFRTKKERYCSNASTDTGWGPTYLFNYVIKLPNYLILLLKKEFFGDIVGKKKKCSIGIAKKGNPVE